MKMSPFIAASLLLGACVSTQSKNPKLPKGEPVQLSARSLDPGECGLFVWTADAQKRLILFSQSQDGRGVWWTDAAEAPLTITDQSGPKTQGQFPEQKFGAANLRLSLRAPQSISYGTRYKAGTLTQLGVGVDAWERVIPVVGLSACQPLTG